MNLSFKGPVLPGVLYAFVIFNAVCHVFHRRTHPCYGLYHVHVILLQLRYSLLPAQVLFHLRPSHGIPSLLLHVVRSHAAPSPTDKNVTLSATSKSLRIVTGAPRHNGMCPFTLSLLSHSSNSQLTPELRHRRPCRETPTSADPSLRCPQESGLHCQCQLWPGPPNR